MSKPDPSTPLSKLQSKIMNVIWERGDVTVADVWNALSTHRKVARNTVLTMLARLEEKGRLQRDTEGYAHRYQAAVTRDATLGTMIERLVETAFGGSAEGLIMALLDGRGFPRRRSQEFAR